MIKSIIKEIFIIVLMTIAIILVLGILLYEYNPTSKKTPNKVEAYTLPEDMQQELNETIAENEKQNIIKTYRVDANDLRIYESTNDYDKGRPDPFDKIGSSTGSSNNNSATGNNTNSNSTGSSGATNNNPQNNSQGSFLNTVGK